MSISQETREAVRLRAQFACEYCGVTETDTGSELTIDHFQPQSRGGADSEDNLVYCCHRCNEFKANYWPTLLEDISLWNPRIERYSDHFTILSNGTLIPTTQVATFTLLRLRLNRLPLVANHLRRHHIAEEDRLLERLNNITNILKNLTSQHAALLREQQELLQAQYRLLRTRTFHHPVDE